MARQCSALAGAQDQLQLWVLAGQGNRFAIAASKGATANAASEIAEAACNPWSADAAVAEIADAVCNVSGQARWKARIWD